MNDESRMLKLNGEAKKRERSKPRIELKTITIPGPKSSLWELVQITLKSASNPNAARLATR
jgi:hypothetical protein